MMNKDDALVFFMIHRKIALRPLPCKSTRLMMTIHLSGRSQISDEELRGLEKPFQQQSNVNFIGKNRQTRFLDLL